VKATVQLFLDNGVQILDLLLSGVLPRHPDTKFVSVESGIGFLPFVLEAADYAFGEAAVRRERPEFELLPSEYFHRQVYGCWFFEETALQRLVDKIGAGNILFETDYPHPICLYGNVREKIDAALGDAPPALRKQVLYDNAAALYRVSP
jgi:predicted TIM-barrel fold metal-dependent hydrolase